MMTPDKTDQKNCAQTIEELRREIKQQKAEILSLKEQLARFDHLHWVNEACGDDLWDD